jgi:hypothetical protein
MAVENNGMVQRGLFLLALVGAIAMVVLFIALRRPTAEAPKSEVRPEQVAMMIAVPAVTYPAAFTWGALFEMGQTLPSAPGWEIRYTATQILALRGSPALPLPVLREMLDEARQTRNFRTRLAGGIDVPDQAGVQQEILLALKAFAEWHKHPEALKAVGADNPELKKVVDAVEKLTDSANNVVRARARETLLALKQA